MDVLRAGNICRLMLWRARHHHRSSLIARERIKEQKSSLTESLLTNESPDIRWCNQQSGKIPRGFLPVYVGPEERRFIIPMVFLSMPDFMKLMESMAEEFGFQQKGGLKISCDEGDFEEILFKCLANHKSTFRTRRK